MSVSKIQQNSLIPPKPADKPRFGEVFKTAQSSENRSSRPGLGDPQSALPDDPSQPTAPLSDAIPDPPDPTELSRSPHETLHDKLDQTLDQTLDEKFDTPIEPPPGFGPDGLLPAPLHESHIAPQTPTDASRSAEVIQHVTAALAAEGWCGTDASGRKIVMLRVSCPGHGQVRIRLRQDADGITVRLRPETQELASLLEANKDQLGQALSARGMTLANLEVVR